MSFAKTSFAVVTFAALQAVAAAAADMPMKAPAYRAVAAPIDWSGFYVGVVGGGGWGRSEQIAPGPISTGHFDISGGTAGGTLGYNWQSGVAVFGVEGDYSWADIDGSTGNCGTTCRTDLRSLGTVRGRLGYAAGQFMPYVTGGYAFGDLRREFGATSGSKTADGWTVGGGIETIFAPHWLAKIEYLYVDFDKTNVVIGGFPTNVDLQAHLFRAGMNYKF